MLEPQSTQPKLSELLTLLEKECSRVLINWEKELDSDEEYLRTIPFSVYNWQQSFCYSVPNKNVQSKLWNSIFSFVSRFFHVNFLQNEDIKYGTSAVLALKLDKLGPANHLLVDAAVASSYDLTKMTQGHTSLLSFAMSQTSVINAGTLMAEIYVVDESKDKIKQLQQCSEVERPYISISCSQSFCDTFFNDVENQLLGEWLSTEADFTNHGIHLQCGGGINSSEVTNSLVWMILHYWKQCCISLKEQDNKFEKSQLETYKFVSYFASSSHSNPHVGIMVPFFVRNNVSSDVTGSLLENVFIAARLLGTSFLVFTSTIRAKKEGIEEKRRLRAAYTKSAISSIMSRNGSHNIGSHVLSALSHNVGTMPDDRVLYQYIQHRMDYIASATTGAPDWSVPTPFVGNLMKMFYSQRHLLDHIAESDGLHAYQYQGKGTQIGDVQSDCVKIVVRKISHSEGEVVGGKSVVEKEVFGKTVYVYEFFQKAPSTSENSDKVSKTEKKGDTSKTEKTDEDVKTVKWENDEAVSIPGGILGQHAFYNIVENVLRNAAKHSWAGNKPKERDAENLEIYVDFEKNQPNEIGQPDGMMCFTVGDNMSRLFPEAFWDDCFRYLDSRDNTIPLPKGRTCWAEVFSLPLDGFHIPLEGETSNRKRIDEFLDGKASFEDLPPQYKALYKYIEHDWSNLIKSSSFMASLKGVPDKKENGDPDDSRPGHRLPLPLHHRQERTLAKPFIDLETNRLRQAAWGLSEMKISAGYLRRAEDSVIGGLEQPKQGEHPLIVPLGVPRSAKGKATWEELCLAYRFWVKLPKDVLIVADDASCSSWSVKVRDWEGVEVKTFNEVLGPKGDIGLMSDYGFVIVDHVGGIEPDDLLKLPFRALRIAQGNEEMAEFPFVLRGELEKAEKRQELVECVYRAWLDYLKRRRYGKDEHKDLIIKMKISEKKGGEKGLVSDRDIYKVLFQECLHSVLEPLVDKHKNLTDLERQAILLISLYPIDETDEMFEKNIEEQFKSEGDYPVATKKLLGEIADRVRAVLNGELEAPNRPSRDMVLRAWRTGLEHSGNEHPGKLIDPLLEFVRGDAHSISVLNGIRDILSDMKKCSRPSAALGTHSLSLDVAIQALETARTTSEVFLRKYEERITTLPQHYRGIGLPEKETIPFNGFGVSVTYAGTKADITYLRHSTDDATLYSEPLSGAQNYLNALSNLSCADSQWAMRLAENGLLRIAVIDERVCKFIADHGEEIRKTYVSMHIAVVDTNTNPVSNPEDLKFPDLTKLSFVVRNETDMDFDLVVVHQGIIDKWWPGRHGKKSVAKILGDLRNPGGMSKLAFPQRFVVVTTGRGRPDNIPETAKVLAFSSIEAFLFKRYPEKLNLVNSLMNILPGSPERSNDNG